MADGGNSNAEFPTRRGFRFGLKALFVVMTLLCLWLGYRVSRERRVAAVIARHDSVLAALDTQIEKSPSSVFYSVSPGRKDELSDRFGNQAKKFRRATSFQVDHSDSTTGQQLVIDVSKLLDAKTHSTTIADQLIQHYGAALAPIGFVQTLSHGNSISQGDSSSQDGKTVNLETNLGACRGIWSSPKSDIHVVIDGQVFSPSKQAIVTILVIDSQQIYLW